MGKFSHTNILESLEFLNGYKRKIDNYKSSKKLDCLILLKSKNYDNLEYLAQDLGISISSVRRWLNTYNSVGLSVYLQKNTRTRHSKIITKEIHLGLKARLEDPLNPFNGFWDAQDWIRDTYGVEVNYKTLWKYITHKLHGKLKVPRKSNIRKDKNASEDFF